MLAAVAAAGIVVLVMRVRRRAAVPSVTSESSPPGRAGERPAPQWPPVPILGVPTEEDLKRYAARDTVFDRFLRREPLPRVPLDDAVRRRLHRWGVAGLVVLLLVVGAQIFEAEVFSHEPRPGAARDTPVGYDENFSLPAEEPDPSGTPISDADCRPTARQPRVRPVKPKTLRAVNRQWRRIERWLKVNAPRSYRTLGKPGKITAIAKAEARMGMNFPDDLRASLLRHDGASFTENTWPFGFLMNWNLSVRGIHGTWQGLCEIDAEDFPSGEPFDPRTDWWDGRMIPIGSDGLGNHLIIDSIRHDVGETDHEGIMDFAPGGIRIRSYLALLKATADALENDGSIGFWKPRAIDGELDWEVL